jgi:omega-hydroxy-beta-dihydromenaquinone-9 sulfotransferase
MSERFAWSNWWRFYRALATRREPRALREAVLRAGIALLAEAGWRLDDRAPLPDRVLLVVGHQRSGTTWLHRLLSAQPGACALPLHGLLFPADAWQSLFRRVGWRPVLTRIEGRLFASLDPLHRIRFCEPEEDEFALWAIFRSPMNALDRPWPPGATPEIDGDEAAHRFYAQVVARATRRSGARYVGKNPHFTHRIDAVRRELPGARFVQLVRHPAEAIASRLSLIRAIWRRRFPGFADLEPHHVETIYRSSVRCYRGGDGRADLDIAYADLVDDAAGTVARIHRFFDLEPPGPGLRQAVAASTRPPGPPPDRLETFGLARERLAADLAPIYSRWGFPP